MAPRNRNRNNKQTQRTAPQTRSTVTTGPMPSAGQRGYVANLPTNAVANYDTRFPAGVAYTAGKPMDQAQADYMNDYTSGRISDSMSFGNWQSSGGYRGNAAQDLTNTLSGIYGKGVVQGSKEQQGIDALMASDGLDYRNATGPQRQQYMMKYAEQQGLTGANAGNAAGATATPTSKSYKDIKSIRGGLKLGGNDVLSKREALKIARNTGRDFDQVLTKGLESGFRIGGAAVRKSNKASGTSQLTPIFSGQKVFINGSSDDPLSQMRRVNPGRRQMYSGTYEVDGKTTPLVESRRGGVNPLSIDGTGGGGGGRRGRRKGKRGRGGAMEEAVMNEPTAADTTAPVESPNVPQEPMTPEEMADASTIGGGVLGGGAGAAGAAGFRRRQSRLRRLGINTMGTGLLGRGLQYGNVFGK